MTKKRHSTVPNEDMYTGIIWQKTATGMKYLNVNVPRNWIEPYIVQDLGEELPIIVMSEIENMFASGLFGDKE